MSRLIGIQHRVKRTQEGKSHPTRLFILENNKGRWLELEDEDAERDWVLGRLPTDFMEVADDSAPDQLDSAGITWQKIEDPSTLVGLSEQVLVIEEDGEFFAYSVPLRYVKISRKLSAEAAAELPHQRKHVKLKLTGRGAARKPQVVSYHRIEEIPVAFDGLRTGDVVVTTFGGSGANFVAGLGQRADQIGAEIYRIRPFELKKARGERRDHSTDARLLAAMYEAGETFHRLRKADREFVYIGEIWRLREQAQKDRMACQQRLYQQAQGKAFREGSDGLQPVGNIEYEFARLKATDATFLAFKNEEARYTKMLDKAVKESELYQYLLEEMDLKGVVGAAIAGSLFPQIGTMLAFAVLPDQEVLEESWAQEQALLAELDMAALELRATGAGVKLQGLNQHDRLCAIRKWARFSGLHAVADRLTEAITIHRKRGRLRQTCRNKGRAKLKRYCGVDVRRWGDHGDTWPHEQLPRFRRGGDWRGNPICRQALYDLFDVALRRSDSKWRAKIDQIKVKLRKKHHTRVNVLTSLKEIFRRVEQIVVESGATYKIAERYMTKQSLRELLAQAQGSLEPERYEQILGEIEESEEKGSETTIIFSNGHIHNMSRWKLASAFVDELYDTWLAFDLKQAGLSIYASAA